MFITVHQGEHAGLMPLSHGHRIGPLPRHHGCQVLISTTPARRKRGRSLPVSQWSPVRGGIAFGSSVISINDRGLSPEDTSRRLLTHGRMVRPKIGHNSGAVLFCNR